MLRRNRTRTGHLVSGPYRILYDERPGHQAIDVDSARSEFLQCCISEVLQKVFGTCGWRRRARDYYLLAKIIRCQSFSATEVMSLITCLMVRYSSNE